MQVDGYVRVSQVSGRSGERFISPAVQREQIGDWAKLHHVQVGEVLEELDQSGAKRDRPLLRKALERVECGESGGIVVAKLDRFGRSLVDGLSNIERIQAAGGTFVSVQDGLDLGTPTGKLILRVMLSMAEWELDRVKETWAMARERAVARGAYLSAHPPFGYRRLASGRLQVDSKAAPLVNELFRRRAGGASVRELTHFLNETGQKTGRGNGFWTDASLRGIVRNRVYLGESQHGEYINRSAHEPLVDPVTWQAGQLPRQRPKKSRRMPLAGLLRCAACRMSMHQTTGYSSIRDMRFYRCGGSSSGGRCPERAVITASALEPLVEDHFFRLLKRRPSNGIRVEQCQQELDQVEDDLAAYRDNPRLLRTLGHERFESGLARRKKRLERALLNLANARRSADRLSLDDPKQLEQRWPELAVGERRKLISQLIDCLFIRGSRGPPTERIHVCLRGEEPVDLPRPGRHRQAGIREFEFPKTSSRANRLHEPRRWSERQIRGALAEFLKDRDGWPAYDEFQAVGQARLWHQVMRYGGPWYWTHDFGIEVENHRLLVPRWNAEHVRNALRPMLRGRERWPTHKEFEAAGMTNLLKAIPSHGGAVYWAKQFGVAHRGYQRVS